MMNYAYTINTVEDAGDYLKPPSEDKEWRLVETHYTAFPVGGGKVFCVWVEQSPASTVEQGYRMQRREIYRSEPDF
jgi:hypothetical protein